MTAPLLNTFHAPQAERLASKLPSISVVVPVYNSEQTLEMLIERLLPVLSKISSLYEVIFVNDGSRDQSGRVARRLSQAFPFLTVIELMRNYGQHNALLAGIRRARYEILITLDDDLQNPPEEIPRLLAGLIEGVDVVYGVPAIEQHGLLRDLASQVTKLTLQNAMGAETARHISAFRIFRTGLREAFSEYRGSFVSIDVLLTWATTRFSAVIVRHEPRHAGPSNYTVRKLIFHAINLMTGFSTLPLQLASLIGFAFTLIGFLILLFVLGRYAIDGGSVPGFPFLASIIALFSGAQMFALGIIGEYLARVHFRMMDKPPYAVRETIGNGA
ncbi:MAG: putative glycosyltransferase [Chthoniobacteraceae bacterium]|nr:putative glycosyltransferase [Chthoniobacteraceae bacterium]